MEDVRQKVKGSRSLTGKEQLKGAQQLYCKSILFSVYIVQHNDSRKWKKRCTSVLVCSVQNAAESLCGKTSQQRDRMNLASVTFKVDQSIFPSQLSHMATARGFPSCMRARVSLNSCQSHPSHRQEPSSNAWKLPPRPHQSRPNRNNHTDPHNSGSPALCHFLTFLSFLYLLKSLMEADWFQEAICDWKHFWEFSKMAVQDFWIRTV